jgi:hypothetical protein
VNARWLIVLGFAILAGAILSGPPSIARATVAGTGLGMFVTALVVKENP